MVPVFTNIGEKYVARNYCPVSLQVFEKFVHNRIVDHLNKCGLFSDS